MTLSTFLFVADALRLEEGVGFHVETQPGTPRPRVETPSEVRERNAQAMAMFSGMMGGVQKGKGRRR